MGGSRYMKDVSAKQLAAIGLFSALVFLATAVLKIPTPTFGYIHIGDAFVLLAGFLLGPVYGGLAAGIGSSLSDLIGGYIIWIPGTFFIKFLTAYAAARVFQALQHISKKNAGPHDNTLRSRSAILQELIPSGVSGELIMTAGYFLYNILIVFFAGGNAQSSLLTAATLSLAEIPFNLAQAAIGIVICLILYPLFMKGTAKMHLSAF